MNLVLILFSDLSSSSGGVETWLKLFLEEVRLNKKQYPVLNVDIYYYEKHYVKNVIGSDIDFVKLHPYQISKKERGLFGNLITLYQFHLYALKNIKANFTSSSFIISVGSYPSGIFNWGIFKFLSYRKSIKHVIWLRTTLEQYIKTHKSNIFSRLILHLERKAINDADIIISNGWDTRENYLANYDIDSTVIPNAINLERYINLQSLSDINLPIKIAFIGRFFENKGIFNFIEAIRIFNNKYSEISSRVTFVFIGWGEKQIQDFALATANCEFVGQVANEDMEAHLNNIFCGVALTKFNKDEAGGSGVSNSLLELMGSGKVIIAYDNPIFRQFPNADFIVYCKENDNYDLAERFADIVRHPGNFISNGTRAKEYSQSFSISSHVSSFFKLLDQNRP